MPTPSEIFAQELSSIGYGLPLWYPEPHVSGEVNIGDVGYIEDGAFIRVLNVLQNPPAPDKIFQFSKNKFSITEHLSDEALRVDDRQGAIAPGPLTSKGIVYNKLAGNVSGNLPSGGAVGVKMEYKCKEECGAMLLLRSEASSSVLVNTNDVKSYIRRHHSEWVDYVNTTLGLGSLSAEHVLFVRGWTKTSADWSATAFMHSGGEVTIALDAGGSPASVGLKYLHGHEIKGPVVPRNGRLVGKTHSGEHKNDQCVFLRYYMLRKRRVFPDKLVAGAGPNDLSGYHDSDDTHAVPSDAIETVDVETEYQSSSSNKRLQWSLSTLLEYILEYILENSDVEYAITCEDDLELLNDGWSNDIQALLRDVRPKIDVIDKCGMISPLDLVCHRRNLQMKRRDAKLMQFTGFTRPSHLEAASLVYGRVLLEPSDSGASDWPHLVFRHKNNENGVLSSVVLSSDGSLLAAAWDDIVITVWTTSNGKTIQNLGGEGHSDSVWSIAFSPDNQRLVSGSSDLSAIIWDVTSGRVLFRLGEHESDVTAVSYSPDGSKIATGSSDGTIKIWNALTGEKVYDLDNHQSEIRELSFSAEGEILASCAESDVVLWNTTSESQVASLEGHEGAILCMAFSPQGDRIITGSEDHSSRIWDASTGEELVTLREHTNSVRSVAFSPDGEQVATASYDGTVVTCDSLSGERKHVFGTPHRSMVEVVAYSKKQGFIASGSSDGNVRVWDAMTGNFIAEYQGHKEKVKGVMFTPDGWNLVSYAEDGTIRIWCVLDTLRVKPAVSVV